MIGARDEGCGEGYGGEEGLLAAIVACCDPPPVLEAPEHDPVPDFSARDAGRDTLFLQGVAEPAGAPWENFDVWRKLDYPFLHPEQITAPTLFRCADADDNAPCVGTEQIYLALKTRGVPTKLIIYPGENHGLTTPSYLMHPMRSNSAWYDRWLKRQALFQRNRLCTGSLPYPHMFICECFC